MNNTNNSRRVAILKEMINSAEAEIISIKNGIVNNNETILRREIMNLLDGVGRGYVLGDYYAPDRYYSDISGVKNIRLIRRNQLYKADTVFVKVLSPIGENLPSTIEVRGEVWDVIFIKSDRYKNEVDY